MKKVSLMTLVTTHVISSWSKLRKNASEYWYITFLMKGGKSINIYLGRKSAAAIDALGLNEGDAIPNDLLKGADVVLSENADHQERYKLSLSTGGTAYANASEMNALFGAKEDISDFDMEAFKATFTGIVVNNPATV